MALPTQLDDGFLFRRLMDSTSDSVYVKDRECRLRRVSAGMVRNLGRADAAELIGKTDFELFDDDFARLTDAEDRRIMEIGEPMIGVVESRHLPGGGVNWTLTSKYPLHDEAGEVIGLIGMTCEINELKQAETNFQHLATHDTLTGLPNRYLMMDRLTQAVARATRDQVPFALLFLDVDDFKAINDAHGHDAGDEILRELSTRLRTSIRASDTAARIGGDEFVAIVEGADFERAIEVADRIRMRIGTSMTLKGSRRRITVSIGIAMFPHHAATAAGLLTAGDQAMYVAKRTGKNRHVVCPNAAA